MGRGIVGAGAVTRGELAELRACAEACLTCRAMLAAVDPVFHGERFGDSLVITGPDGGRRQWDGAAWSPAGKD